MEHGDGATVPVYTELSNSFDTLIYTCRSCFAIVLDLRRKSPLPHEKAAGTGKRKKQEYLCRMEE